MTDRIFTALLIALFAFAAVTLWAMFNTAADCHSTGGTVVRGMFWLECIR
jgi:hypothetical protein